MENQINYTETDVLEVKKNKQTAKTEKKDNKKKKNVTIDAIKEVRIIDAAKWW